VLLGHWFEMRARGSANDAIRTLLDLAPPIAVVLRDGQPVEVPTVGVVVGDLLLVRPGAKIAVDGVVEEGESEAGSFRSHSSRHRHDRLTAQEGHHVPGHPYPAQLDFRGDQHLAAARRRHRG
jgi:hypothetical protein